ncbi:transporter substrate-binding domain-containing protein [Alysiella filiformis]|uniref:Polar amino acid transport system substrate-binding protein n=1 Tax=Alysiella filiformis DSM 16848 TaxID=1120981 RepID=A0A286EFL1_9NEIS|nr:transporter substrate-binding domain-containing protein [Alysiella filiformis]QMT30508.1 transporter substrate-binding domain-containing protein [Alysiella filiformis]UBQ56512.1 transporter substrate-binding domain-containing protein [Alysiella filiformis DSM 16848]SOD69716.1 polar amino acid transport system substrate-binding protein [Alysiella filiformis DSM 16848]
MAFKKTLTILATAIMLAACADDAPKNEQTHAAPVASEPVAASVVAQNANLPTLRVVTDATYPPFASKDKNGQIEGLDVDLFTAVARNQGYNVQFVPHDWEGIFKTLANDTADVVVSAVSETDESLAAADLSDSYYHTPYRIAALEPAKFDLKDWATQAKIAISNTEDSSVDLPERYKVKKEQLVIRDSVFLALQEVAKGNAQVVVADSTVLQYYIASPTFKDHNIKFVSQNLPAGRGSDIVYAVKKGNKDLLGKINKGLANIKANGEYEKILNKWNQSLPTANAAK